MRISDDVLCLYSGEIEKRDGSYIIEIPEREVSLGELDDGRAYRVALLPAQTEGSAGPREEQHRRQAPPTPPVEQGEQRTVDIEDIGEQGDGIARVDRGYVVIVPDTEQGERVTIEITDVRENMGFAEVVDREDYYE